MELEVIQNKIFEVRGCRVMLDFHLAELYGVETRTLKQAVRRNSDRFPEDFMFELTESEYNVLKQSLRSQSVISNERGGRRHMPFAFTEQGVAMLSSVLRSDTAVKMNIAIMRTFVMMRRLSAGYEELQRRIEELEISTDTQFNEIYQALTKLLSKSEESSAPRRKIGYRTSED
jgi:hypothetical protein